jgi:hypothetical protein
MQCGTNAVAKKGKPMQYVEIAVYIIAWGIPALMLLWAFSLWGKSKVAATLVFLGVLAWTPIYEYLRPDVNHTVMADPATDIIRVDEGNQNRDVRVIYTTDPMEYYNEDARTWLKWDSGRMTNRAGALAGQEVTVVSTGIRFGFLSMYPNAVALNPGVMTWILILTHYAVFLLPFVALAFIGRKIAGKKKIA